MKLYFGLRQYDTATWTGGDAACGHIERYPRTDITPESLARRAEKYGTGTGNGSLVPPIQYRDVCAKCGARSVDYQIGLEPSPSSYVDQIVTVFREVRRVLKDTGVAWIVIGDSFSSGGRTTQTTATLRRNVTTKANGHLDTFSVRPGNGGNVKPKDLLGIPWMVAFALRDDGWYLRQAIIWNKPSAMCESVQDRPTTAHEYVLLLAKQERYYYDGAAIAELAVSRVGSRAGYAGYDKRAYAMGREPSGNEKPGAKAYNIETRNARSVWTIASEPYSGSHYAAYPTALVTKCVLAGSRPNDLILDPFIGSGTTGLCAERLGRRWVGLDLAYQNLAAERTAQRGLRFEFDELTAP